MARETFSTSRICRGTDYERTHRVYFKESERHEAQKGKRYENLKKFHDEHQEELSMLFATLDVESPVSTSKEPEIPLDTKGWMPMFGTKMMSMTYGEAKSLGWEDKWSRVKYR